MPLRFEQVKKSVEKSLCQQDQDNLRASGLTEATIHANQLRTHNGSLEFLYRDLDGNTNCFVRRRPHHPRTDKKTGKEIKYEQPKGTPSRGYYPAECLNALKNADCPLFVVEGEKKALALAQLPVPTSPFSDERKWLHRFAVVGIGGIWCGCKKDSDDLIDDVAILPLEGRTVYFVFDYDDKPKVQRDKLAARTKLANAFQRKGAGEIYYIEPPAGIAGQKVGLDDYLATVSEKDEGFENLKDRYFAFAELMEKALPIGRLMKTARGEGISVIKIVTGVPPTLGEAAYHGPIGKFLRAVAPYTEATDAGILAHLLPMVGMMIGPRFHVYAGGKHYPRFNTNIVGRTSKGRKGTALQPADELMRFLAPELWKTNRASGLSSGEGLIDAVADKKDDEGNVIPTEKRLCIVEEEYSKVLAQIRREGNILSQVIRECYDSGNLSNLTKTPSNAQGAHVTVIGHITPEELLDRFNHIEMANGFGNRSLWFYVSSEKEIPWCDPVPQKVYEDFKESIRHLLPQSELQESIEQLFKVDTPVKMADACKRRWVEDKVYSYLREDRPGLHGALLGRGPAMVLRLALVYCLLDPPPRGGSPEIQPEHLEAALAVWDYCEESVKMVFKSKSGTFLGDKVLDLLRIQPLTKDQFNAHLSNNQKKELDKVLTTLEAANLVRKKDVQTGQRGRPATLWELVG